MRFTVYTPGSSYEWMGFWSVSDSPSPKLQSHSSANPNDSSVNETANGFIPAVGVPENSAWMGAQASLASQPNPWGQMAGGLAGGLGMGMGMGMMSSIELKENVVPIEDALDKVTKLEGVTFDWRQTNCQDGGVIAEQVEEILPEAVVMVNGVKCIKPMMIIGYLIEAVKELSGRL